MFDFPSLLKGSKQQFRSYNGEKVHTPRRRPFRVEEDNKKWNADILERYVRVKLRRSIHNWFLINDATLQTFLTLHNFA